MFSVCYDVVSLITDNMLKKTKQPLYRTLTEPGTGALF